MPITQYPAEFGTKAIIENRKITNASNFNEHIKMIAKTYLPEIFI